MFVQHLAVVPVHSELTAPPGGSDDQWGPGYEVTVGLHLLERVFEVANLLPVVLSLLRQSLVKTAQEQLVQLVVGHVQLAVVVQVLLGEVPLLSVDVLVLGDVQNVLNIPAKKPPEQDERLVKELGDHDEVEILAQDLEVLVPERFVGDVRVFHTKVL